MSDSRRDRSPDSRSRSPRRRSRSPQRGGGGGGGGGGRYNRVTAENDPDAIVMKLVDADVAFILGKGGKTKMKIAHVSRAELEVHESNLTLTIRGKEENRNRAKEYVDLVLAQRVGTVYIDFEQTRPDLTVVAVPSDCVGYVTGRGGAVLRSLEQEWGTLMFFAKQKGETGRAATEKLAIYGTRRGRRGAELKVMSAVEHKSSGFFLDGNTLRVPLDSGDSEEDFGTDQMDLSEDDFSYALGSKGSTRKKLATAAGCILEYVGRLAFMCGAKAERERARDYLGWLLQQRVGKVSVHCGGREDVTIVEVKQEFVGYITGYKGSSLRAIEADSGTFCFADGDKTDTDKGTEKILIFSGNENNRRRAANIIEQRINDKTSMDRRDRDGGGRGGGGYQRDDRGSRARYEQDRRGGRESYRDDRRRDDYRRDDRGRDDYRRDDRGRDDHRRDDRGRDDRRDDRGRDRSRERRRSRSRDRR